MRSVQVRLSNYNRHNNYASFEAFTVAIFQVEVFLVVTPCGVVVGHISL
jgi:hypothetical protein